MPGHDDDFGDEFEPKYFGMYTGTVVKRNKKRVRFTIPGFIEPESPWAIPIGAAGGGGKDRGLIGTPKLGATVCIWFANGELEHPYYCPANWGDDEIPEEVVDREDAVIWSSETFAIILDETNGARKLRIVSRKTEEDFIEFNPEENSMTISASTQLEIKALGQILIDGAQVLVNGRKIIPSGEVI